MASKKKATSKAKQKKKKKSAPKICGASHPCLEEAKCKLAPGHAYEHCAEIPTDKSWVVEDRWA